jgi:hypothetical protein
MGCGAQYDSARIGRLRGRDAENEMKLSTFSFEPENRWSVSQFPDLDSPQTLLLVFAATEYIDQPQYLSELVAAYPQSTIVGCSTAGEISGPYINDGTITVMVVRFEHSRVANVSADIHDANDSQKIGEQLARQLAAPDLCGVFVLCDGLHVNGSALAKGLSSVLPPGVAITGGLAGDGSRFRQTWVLRDGKPQGNAVTATGLYGQRLRITHGSGGGWDSFGPERRVTRSQGRVLHELDGRPALALYKEYLGERASGLPATGLLFPLSIRQDASDNRQLVRTIRAVDEANQSMTFAGDIPRGYLAQLMRANFDRLIHGASTASNQAGKQLEASDNLLSIAISCVGRRLVLGERSEEETEMTLEGLPAGTQQTGFYSYGEICPHADGACDLHNQTMTITTFSEV